MEALRDYTRRKLTTPCVSTIHQAAELLSARQCANSE
jgi:hypothetical protein